MSKIRKDNNFQDLNVIIDDFAQNNDCMQFFLSPNNYSSPEKVEIDWILKLENRADFFKNDIYRNKLKEYIKVNTLNKESLNYLVGLL